MWETTNARGYPSCNVRFEERKFSLAHRLSYVVFNGNLPDGVAVHHTCGTPRCVNPAHLQAADHAENTLESLERKAYRSRIAELETELKKIRTDIADG
jgi:hypothetical protein